MTMGFFGPGDLRLLGVPGCGRVFFSHFLVQQENNRVVVRPLWGLRYQRGGVRARDFMGRQLHEGGSGQG